MTTMCHCGHALSQHPTRGPCDYDGYSCNCKKYVRAVPKARAEGDDGQMARRVPGRKGTDA